MSAFHPALCENPLRLPSLTVLAHSFLLASCRPSGLAVSSARVYGVPPHQSDLEIMK